MYFYDVGYNSHEECPSVSLFHETEFTKEQFNDIVSDAFASAWKQSKWREHNEKQEDDFDKMRISCDDVLDDAIKILCADYGFNTVKYNHTFLPFGWASLEDPDDWKNEIGNDKKLDLIRNKVNQIIIQENRENRLSKILDNERKKR